MKQRRAESREQEKSFYLSLTPSSRFYALSEIKLKGVK
jgi:hypothetical protein